MKPYSNQEYQPNTVQQYHDEVTRLFDAYYDAKKADEPIPPNNRVLNANELIEHYIEQHGKRPPNSVLSRLATYILLDVLSDSHPDKMARDEYPIASYAQVGRQYDRMTGLSPAPYSEDDVMGRSSDGDILAAESGEQRARDWRLFLREVLNDREYFIIESIYEKGMTQAEVAAELDVSQPRIAVIVAEIYHKLALYF